MCEVDLTVSSAEHRTGAFLLEKNMNREIIIKHNKIKAAWRKANPEKMAIYRERWIKKNPWVGNYNHAKQRCCNPGSLGFDRYGGRGIKFLMTLKDFGHLWFRDKAFDMKCPSIDRIDNDGHYELSNCQYTERDENSLKSNLGSTKRGVEVEQYSENTGKFIKRWKSIKSLCDNLGVKHPTITNRLNGKFKSFRGFVFKRKVDNGGVG